VVPANPRFNDACDSRRTLTRDFYLGGDKGYLDIEQLTSAYISPIELVQSLDIGFGFAKLIIHYADEDVASIHNGTFLLLATN